MHAAPAPAPAAPAMPQPESVAPAVGGGPQPLAGAGGPGTGAGGGRSRRGGGSRRPVLQPDGFRSSAGDPALAAKYGNSYPVASFADTPATGGDSGAGTPTPVAGGTPPSAHGSGPPAAWTSAREGLAEGVRAVMSQLQEAGLNSMQQSQVDQGRQALDTLRAAFEANRVTEPVAETVDQMLTAAGSYDFATAVAQQGFLASTHWADHKDWLRGLKYFLTVADRKYKEAMAGAQ